MHIRQSSNRSRFWKEGETLDPERSENGFSKVVLERAARDALDQHADPVDRSPVLKLGARLIDQRPREHVSRVAREVFEANGPRPLDVLRVFERVAKARYKGRC